METKTEQKISYTDILNSPISGFYLLAIVLYKY